MNAVRRWYIYLVCIVSLQAVAWAAISLLRDLSSRHGSRLITQRSRSPSSSSACRCTCPLAVGATTGAA